MKSLGNCQFLDIHYHASPDLYQRRLTAIQAGISYKSLNGAVVLKSHLGSTSVQASLAQAQGLPVLPSLVLNAIAGGINYQVVLRALTEYQPTIMNAKILVHFPTITGRKYQSKLTRQLNYPYLSEFSLKGETLTNDKNFLKPEVIDILKMSKDYPIVLSTGHASKYEVYALIDACIKYNVAALLLNQPANPLTGIQAPELQELARHDFIWIEQTALTYLIGHQSKEDFTEVISHVPRVIYSSDLGQPSQMDVPAWYQYSKTLFNTLKLSTLRKDELWRLNALRFLAIN